MEYTANGVITLSPFSKLKLNSEVDFTSPSKAHISLKSNSDDSLSVSIFLEADNVNDARELASIELGRICDTLCFFHRVPISRIQIKGVSYKTVDSDGRVIRVIEEGGFDRRGTISVVRIVDDSCIEKLVVQLKQEYPREFEDFMNMWTEAISSETPTLTYLLLYRLLEFRFKNDTNKLTEWIRGKEPNVQMKYDRARKGNVTIYTHLRDNIHRKQKSFPFKEIHDHLSEFQILAYQAIRERFGIQ